MHIFSRRYALHPLIPITYLFIIISFTSSELEILVKNGGYDILKTKLTANTTDDIITAEFIESDGSHVSQLVDFKSGIQIFQVYILGEHERAQNNFQIFCFIISLKSSDFIPSDAMSKLRQKNPGTIRIAEEDKGFEEFDFDMLVDSQKSSIISKHINRMCSKAPHSTYIHTMTLDSVLQNSGGTENISDIFSAGTTLPISDGTKCSEVHVPEKSCLCDYTICFHWYPCGIKYCKDHDISSGKTVSRRCGIRTCKKCRLFHFHVPNKLQCLWDEVPLLAS